MSKSFDERCYDLLRRVPGGKVTTYGEIARAVGCFGGARAVGNAMNKNPYGYVENQRFSPDSEAKASDNLFFCETRLPKEKFLKTCSTKEKLNVNNIEEKDRVACHRVVKSNGEVGGFTSGVEVKIEMLEAEGVEIRGGRVVDFEEKLFRF